MDTKLKCVFEMPENSNSVAKPQSTKAPSTTSKPSDTNSVDGKTEKVADAPKSSPKVR